MDRIRRAELSRWPHLQKAIARLLLKEARISQRKGRGYINSLSRAEASRWDYLRRNVKPLLLQAARISQREEKMKKNMGLPSSSKDGHQEPSAARFGYLGEFSEEIQAAELAEVNEILWLRDLNDKEKRVDALHWRAYARVIRRDLEKELSRPPESRHVYQDWNTARFGYLGESSPEIQAAELKESNEILFLEDKKEKERRVFQQRYRGYARVIMHQIEKNKTTEDEDEGDADADADADAGRSWCPSRC